MNDGKKILIVDDEVHILHVLSLKLRMAGYEVIMARDGRDALEMAQVEQPDLIITDYQMPYLSGIELCQRLRQITTTKDIPAVLLTARGFSLDNDVMASAGLVRCLHKPFSPREVVKMVDDLLAPAVA